MTDLAGKRLLLTGGTTGIGRAMLDLFARRGARIVTIARDEAALDEACRTAGGEVHGVAGDLARRDDIDRLFAAVDARLGGLDIFVSNAALGADPIENMAEDDWRYVVETNLVAAMGCTRRALDRMDASGQIIVIGSISSDIHAPGESVYSATKAGLAAFAETLRKEVKPRGIRLGLVQPGSVGSDMQAASAEEQRAKIARKEMLCAEDVAEAVAFMLTRPPRVDIVTLRIEPQRQELP